MSALNTIAAILSKGWVHGYEARRGIETFAHHLCAALKLAPVTVEWSRGFRTAAMSATGRMLLADMRDDERIERARVARLAAYVLHELLHRRYTDFSASDNRRFVASLHNALEDAWIERRAAREALVGNVRPLLVSLLQDMVNEARAEVDDWTNPAQYPFALAVLARGYGLTVPVPHKLLPLFRAAADKVDACQTSHDTLRLARELFDAMQQQQEQQQQEQEQEQQQQQQEQEQEQQQQEQEQQDEGQDAGEQAGDQQQAGEAGEQAGQEPGQEPGQDGQEGAQEATKRGGEGEGTGQDAGEPQDAGKPQPCTEWTRAREVEPKDKGSTGPGGSYTREAQAGEKAEVYTSDNWGASIAAPARLRYEVRRLFENTAREWKDGGFRAGSLHRAALHRVALDRPDVFARRFSQDGIDTAVAVLLDISGSMCRDDQGTGARMDCAVDACGMLLDCLAQAGAQTMVLGFGTDTVMLKTWGQPWKRAMPTLRRIKLQGHTNDYHALRMAHDALLAHPAQRRVVLAITDGQGHMERTRMQRQSGEALGIQHLAIGIAEDVAYTWGQASTTIHNPADLGRVALSKLAQA